MKSPASPEGTAPPSLSGAETREDLVRIISEQAQALEKAHRRIAELELVIENAPIALYITRDVEARRIDANAAGLALTGLTQGDNASLALPPGTPRPFQPVRDGRPLPLDEMPMQAAARFGREVRELEYEIHRPDGSIRSVVANARPLLDARGNRRGAVGALMDVTARKLAEAERQRAEEALRESDRRKSHFLNVLSHELRNPLAAIANSLAIIERATPGSGAPERAHAVLRRQAGHLTRLVDDLLDVNRIERGAIELQRARLDAREVVRSVCDDLRPAFRNKGVWLGQVEPPEPVWVEADATRLAQMVGNLLSNALKFTPSGGRVAVEVSRPGAWCRVTIRDTGMGVVADDLERIFEPFTQGEAGRLLAGGGLGIGLALTRHLAALHGGAVRARSDGANRGAELELDLPVCAEPAAPAPAKAALPDLSGRSILIVEDNEDAGATLAELLTRMGNRVRVEASGQRGIEAALADRPDVLVCDVGLPDLTGYEVIRRLRAAAPSEGLFAVALTGYAQPRDREQALAAGFDAHLAKPLSLEALAQILARAPTGRRPAS